ncbi:hypothetical protein BZA77DRAFT_329781 [Pyronema omphalodes]|nr:hypothetical protein BZA77DRAFT_329781 [Pyronema omphalodes]
MDGFTIATGVTGFLGLALETSKILEAYVDAVQSAPEDVRNILAEVTALYHALKQFVRFIEEDYNESFAETSVLVAAIADYKDQITKLYKQVKKIELRCEKCQSAQFMEPLEWPICKEDYGSTILSFQRFTRIFQFASNMSNCKLLAETPDGMMEKLKARQNQVEQALDDYRSLQLPGIEALLAASKKRVDIREDVTKMLELSREKRQNVSTETPITDGIAEDPDMKSLLRWLSPLDPLTRHRQVQSKRVSNTGEWFLNSDIFRKWRDDSHGVNIFGCYGDPGAGKTFISSHVIDHLSSRSTSENTCIAFMYCDHMDQKEQTVVHVLGGLLKQAITESKEGCTEIIQSLLRKKRFRGSLEVYDAMYALSQLLRGFEKTYICIDALDECKEEDRKCLIKYLTELSAFSDRNNAPRIQLFFTGRPSMQKYVKSHHPVNSRINLSFKLKSIAEDIAAYVAHKIDHDKMVGMDDAFKKHIVEEIASASRGIFLSPILQIDAVLDQPTIRKRREALQNMPKDLYDVFEFTLDRIRAQKQSTARVALQSLQWIFLAARPLSPEELRHALAVESGDTKLHEDNLLEPQFILNACLGLVIVDESTSTVRLVHKSLQDYFQEQYDQGVLFKEGHMDIASICMTYMSFGHFNQEIETLQEKILDRYPLLGYAATRWDYHLRSSKIRCPAVEDTAVIMVTEKYISQRALQILSTCRLREPICFLDRAERYLQDVLCDNSEWTTECFPLHIAATAGSPALFRRVFDCTKGDINAKDTWGNCVLTLATTAGHLTLVDSILSPPYNANVNSYDAESFTALFWAAWGGHSDVVKLLLEQDGIEVDKVDDYDRTPLSLAAHAGHTSVVKLLLEEGRIDVNTTNHCLDMPLSLAAGEGHTEVVRLLLEQDSVDVNNANAWGDAPLSLPALKGHSEVLKLFLQHGATVDTRDNYGRTPLSLAAQYHRIESVNILLKASANINATDERHGRTPLMWSFCDPHDNESKNYHNLNILKAFLSRPGVNINSKANDGSTALSTAVEYGLHEAEELLRAHGAV